MSAFVPTLADLYGSIRDDLARVRLIFDEEVLSHYAFVNELCETVRSYRGKMLRPALLLLSGKACGELSSVHHVLGAVVEMVHMATLVHDDVLDGADERRRRPTIRRLSGNTSAVLLGDYLISHAFHLCSSLNDQHASRRIGHSTNVVCEGEMLQNIEAHNVSLSEGGYLEILRRKTGALTAVACELGAKFAGAEDEVVEAMVVYGMSVGVAFQIVDDVLDITGDEQELGKTLGMDAGLGKPTLPTIHCLAHAGARERQQLIQCLSGNGRVDRDTLESWLRGTDSLTYALDVAQQQVAQAVA
ncbi:MAG: polyprenyl synthetase family protein, partial [Kiloniellales bacterium]|nr:polyprenyl synthetase family protein [Kiloniellales bacterium]